MSKLSHSKLVGGATRGSAPEPLGDPVAAPDPLPERHERREAAPTRPSGGELAETARAAGLRRVAMVAWRDLHDAEAGGSELHAHEIARRWAAAGVEVMLRTSKVRGAPRRLERDGYLVDRHRGRYGIFASAPLGLRRRDPDALVEIWNGMPFFSPLWFGGRRAVFLHHVHAEMWDMVLPPGLARAGRWIEAVAAPPIYRSSPVVTLSESSKTEIVELLGLRPERVFVVPPGIDGRFSPGGLRADHPLVVAVGRLVPVKRLERLVGAAAALRPRHPGLEVVIAGEGYERGALEGAIAAAGLRGVVRLAGRVDDDALVDLYRRAWVLASTSVREGWGMTITEAAACGTPAVASRIAGHLDAVSGEGGILFDSDA
ncbi:MAG: glycosyltransferase family 4 protein, partial [Acidimicrobiales bacterium]